VNEEESSDIDDTDIEDAAIPVSSENDASRSPRE